MSFVVYADWTHPIDERFANVRAYRARLLARPSYAQALDEAGPYQARPPTAVLRDVPLPAFPGS